MTAKKFKQHIAEVEGLRTPTGKKSKKDLEAGLKDLTDKRAAKKAKAETAKPAKVTETVKDQKKDAPAAKPKASAPVAIADIPRSKVTANGGNIVSGGYDAKTKRLHVEFDKSIWEYPNTTAEEWTGLEETFSNKDVDTGAYFRKAFRGRAGSSRRVYDRSSGNGTAEAAAPVVAKANGNGKKPAAKAKSSNGNGAGKPAPAPKSNPAEVR